MLEITVFTDGSTLNNQKRGNRKGGVGVFFNDNDDNNISLPLKETNDFKVTNNVAELLGAVMAIEKILGNMKIGKKKIILYTDSMYVINIVNTWGKSWEKNNWRKSNNKKVDNIELVKKLYYYSQNIKIKFIHSKGHSKEPSKNDPNYFIWYGNTMADSLAVSASKSI